MATSWMNRPVKTYCECGVGKLHGEVTVLAADIVIKRRDELIVVADSCPHHAAVDANCEFVYQGKDYALYRTLRPTLFS